MGWWKKKKEALLRAPFAMRAAERRKNEKESYKWNHALLFRRIELLSARARLSPGLVRLEMSGESLEFQSSVYYCMYIFLFLGLAALKVALMWRRSALLNEAAQLFEVGGRNPGFFFFFLFYYFPDFFGREGVLMFRKRHSNIPMFFGIRPSGTIGPAASSCMYHSTLT